MRALLGVMLLGLSSLANAEFHHLRCEVIGFAYSYETKRFYESKKAHFMFDATNRCTDARSHAKNEWDSFFSSEVPKSYKYTTGVHSDCGCYDRAPRVTRAHQDFKRTFVHKDFHIKRLRGFHPEDRDL